MARRITEPDLAILLRIALAAADDLCLWGVGARIDQALVELTGAGALPFEDGAIPADART